MIPKKIHYCWFGKNELPTKAKKCIASWKKYCPDYEIVEWNEDNYDVHQNAYTTYSRSAWENGSSGRWMLSPRYCLFSTASAKMSSCSRRYSSMETHTWDEDRYR